MDNANVSGVRVNRKVTATGKIKKGKKLFCLLEGIKKRESEGSGLSSVTQSSEEKFGRELSLV